MWNTGKTMVIQFQHEAQLCLLLCVAKSRDPVHLVTITTNVGPEGLLLKDPVQRCRP